MAVIIFLIDNSCSMGQRTHMATSYLDIAKSCVITFIKIRQKTSRTDSYFLLTLDASEYLKLSCWQSSGDLSQVEEALDAVSLCSLTKLGSGLKHCFNILNVHRVRKELETFALGRYPNRIEPAIIICLTDGQPLFHEEESLMTSLFSLNAKPSSASLPGEDLYVEPFRWDYRLYAISLRFPSVPEADFEAPKFIPSDTNCPIGALCLASGGRAYEIRNEKMLNQCLESLGQKLVPGVMVRFIKVIENGELSQKWHDTSRMILIRQLAKFGGELVPSHWPIPEAFWVDSHSTFEDIKPRNSLPSIWFSMAKLEALPLSRLTRLPTDVYDLEPSPLTQFMLAKCEPAVLLPCFIVQPQLGLQSVPVTGCRNPEAPFAYLRVTEDRSGVQLHVSCYNFPRLLILLDEFDKTFKKTIPTDWHAKLLAFAKSLPSYYIHPLEKAMSAYGFKGIIPEDMTRKAISNDVRQKLLRLKQPAEKEYLKLTTRCAPLTRISHKIYSRRKRTITLMNSDQKPFPLTLETASQTARNVFSHTDDIGRHQLVTNLRLIHFCASELESQSLFGGRRCPQRALPLCQVNRFQQATAQMGDYDVYGSSSSLVPQLRSLDPPPPPRADSFGNPFKTKAQPKFQADESFVESPSGGNVLQSVNGCVVPGGGLHWTSSAVGGQTSRKRRRKGPLPADLTVHSWRQLLTSASVSECSASECSGSESGASSPGSPQINGLPADDLHDSQEEELEDHHHYQEEQQQQQQFERFHWPQEAGHFEKDFRRIQRLCRELRLDVGPLLECIFHRAARKEQDDKEDHSQREVLLLRQAGVELRRLRKSALWQQLCSAATSRLLRPS